MAHHPARCAKPGVAPSPITFYRVASKARKLTNAGRDAPREST
jgi:hypothetical protein